MHITLRVRPLKRLFTFCETFGLAIIYNINLVIVLLWWREGGVGGRLVWGPVL